MDCLLLKGFIDPETGFEKLNAKIIKSYHLISTIGSEDLVGG